ncbi:MAG: NADH-quinone oxidoreductase subunit J [Candidatus Hinthialibacter antarcticus]|nr:NADH-quinone oxidoreductase subunit J [Candidatus Hinthialibacter antarcticus]
MAGTLFFWVCALTAVFAGLGVIVARSPMHSAVSLIATLVSIAGLFLTLHAEFLAWILVIVYTGAVMVLIIFVISLLNLDREEPIDYTTQRKWGLAVLVLFFLFFLAYLFSDPMVTLTTPEKPMLPDDWGSAKSLAIDLFTRYMVVVQLAGVLLTAAVIGAVVVARKPEDEEGGDSAV